MLHNNNMQSLVHTLLHSKMSKLYIYQALIAFVTSLVGIFIPVYLFTEGYSLIMIMLYVIGLSLTYIICAPTVVAIINKIGMKYTLLLSTPFYFIYLVSLQFVGTSTIYFHILWISQGIYTSLFWFTFRAEVITNSSRKKRSSEIGTLQIIATLLTTIAPVIGGYFLEFIGYWELLIVATIFLILSNIPLIISKDRKIHKIYFKHSDYLKLIKKKSNNRTKVAHMSEGIELALSTYIWPLILFLFVKENFALLGILYTTLSIITIIILSYIKTYLDTHSKKKVLKITSGLLALGWFGRVILALFGSLFLYLFESFAKLITNVLNLTFTSIFYNNTNPKTYIEALLTRVLYLHGARVLFCMLIILLLMIIENNFSNLVMILTVGIFSAVGMNSLVENDIY